MAKRAPAGEEPYRPLLDPGVISAALTKADVPPTQQAPAVVRVVELNHAESITPEAKGAPFRRVPLEPAPARVTACELVEKLDQEKRMLLTRAEGAALDRVVGALASRLNTAIKSSHVLRALVTLLLNAEAAVDRRAGEAVGLLRPPNADLKGIQIFEREIARIIAAALRDAGPPRDLQL